MYDVMEKFLSRHVELSPKVLLDIRGGAPSIVLRCYAIPRVLLPYCLIDRGTLTPVECRMGRDVMGFSDDSPVACCLPLLFVTSHA